MAGDDWFRNTTWDAETETAFKERLGRARKKSHYLRIQSYYLADTHPIVALDLIEQYFRLDERFEDAQAHVQRARALIALDDLDGAATAYEAALECERLQPSLKTQARVDFPRLVVERQMTSLYVRALDVLNANQDQLSFPVERYCLFGARAIILHHFGRREEARRDAISAMAAARETQSGFGYHQDLGLVEDAGDDFAMRIAALAG